MAELQIQLLGLSGASLRLSMARSSTGRELRQQVAELLEAKPGAKVSLRHGDKELAMGKTLEDWEMDV